jgi:hypothetical protein
MMYHMCYAPYYEIDNSCPLEYATARRVRENSATYQRSTSHEVAAVVVDGLPSRTSRCGLLAGLLADFSLTLSSHSTIPDTGTLSSLLSISNSFAIFERHRTTSVVPVRYAVPHDVLPLLPLLLLVSSQ